MEIILRPGSLQNEGYRLNIPAEFRDALHSAFENQPIRLILNHNVVVEIPQDNPTFRNHNGLTNPEINDWLHSMDAVPYENGNPPRLMFWLVKIDDSALLVFHRTDI